LQDGQIKEEEEDKKREKTFIFLIQSILFFNGG
jgi:hypothetical protein